MKPKNDESDTLAEAYWLGKLDPEADAADAPDDARPADVLGDFLRELQTRHLVIRCRRQTIDLPLFVALIIGVAVPQAAGLVVMGALFGWWRVSLTQARVDNTADHPTKRKFSL